MQFLFPKGNKDTLRQGTVSVGEVVERAGILQWGHKRTSSLCDSLRCKALGMHKGDTGFM